MCWGDESSTDILRLVNIGILIFSGRAVTNRVLNVYLSGGVGHWAANATIRSQSPATPDFSSYLTRCKSSAALRAVERCMNRLYMAQITCSKFQ